MWAFVLKLFGFSQAPGAAAAPARLKAADLRQDWNGTVLSMETYR